MRSCICMCEYFCLFVCARALLIGDSYEKWLSFHISVPPTMTQVGPLSRSVTIGQSIELPCKANGFPKPKIQWQKGTRVFMDSKGNTHTHTHTHAHTHTHIYIYIYIYIFAGLSCVSVCSGVM